MQAGSRGYDTFDCFRWVLKSIEARRSICLIELTAMTTSLTRVQVRFLEIVGGAGCISPQSSIYMRMLAWGFPWPVGGSRYRGCR